MNFGDFEVHATPFIAKAYCKVCGFGLRNIMDGWFGRALVCPACKSVYRVKLVREPRKRVNVEYINDVIKKEKYVD
ncbi:MAG: hypothetical protein GTO54_12885 [Nitrososphaeria archaeon]|nr:hypothetical protein [Nitrososphaeria archaeon]